MRESEFELWLYAVDRVWKRTKTRVRVRASGFLFRRFTLEAYNYSIGPLTLDQAFEYLEEHSEVSED